MRKKLLSFLLSLTLILSLTAIPAAALSVEDARQLLQEYYVDKIPDDVLSRDSLDEILDALGDPYTVYMSAEQYQQFISAVNGDTVVGIGVSIQSEFDNGYKIMSILPNSPALEAGLQAGDHIIAVDGDTRTDGMEVRSLIAGEAGTSVTITVIRQSDGGQKDYTMTRRSVVIPIVTYDAVDSAGVINCISFGDSTVGTIGEALTTLNDDVSTWILDLRSNPGGTSEAAAGAAGLFVGSDIMVYFRNAEGKYNFLYTMPNCPDLTDKPLIILTSPYSASGSELFTADARDHGFGIAVGQRTFGKGIAQIVLDDTNTDGLFNGDALKITAYRFYSPDGTTNHKIGIIPTLTVSAENTAAVALLLSQPTPSCAEGFFKLNLAGQTFYFSRKTVANVNNKTAVTELLEALPPSAALYKGYAGSTWNPISPADLAAELKLAYTARSFSDISGTTFEKEIETLTASELLSGYADGTFRPDAFITRAEFCAMVSTALNLPSSGKPLPFSDTDDSAWYSNAVSAMSSLGFLSGYGDGTFRPNSTITYEEMVTILSSVAAWSNMDGYAMSQENEVPVGEWLNYQDFSSWAQVPAWTLDHLGGLVGDLTPAETCTRGVAAGALCSLMENIHLLWD
ncbi:MAG: S41 family peptidase, partial [Lawsonibacter sp.]|nr:S41 family peptidase [Lawsonibacter sp.]